MAKVPAQAFRRQITSLIPVYMNVLMMGCGTGWIPNAMYFLTTGENSHVTPSQCALIASFSIFGRLAFALPAGFLADKYGRKEITVGVALLHSIAWIGMSLDSSLVTIYIGRFIIGLAEAMINATALIAIGEMASPENRGQLTSLYQIAMTIGGISSSIISLLFSSYNMLSWGTAFLSVLSFLSMFWVSETPSFLISVSKVKQAKIKLRYIRQGYQKSEINVEFDKLKTYIEDENNRKSHLSWINFLKTKSIRKPLLIGILMNFFSRSAGGMLVRNYITIIIPANEFVPKRYYPLVMQIILLFISANATFFIDKIRRRTLILFGAAAMVIINGCCAVTNYLMIQNPNEYIFTWIFILENVLTIICYAVSIQPVTSVLKSELYPQSVKGFCGSMGTISQALSSVFSYQLYNVVGGSSHLYAVYIIFLINSFLLFSMLYFLLPEGLAMSLTDLQMTFKESSPTKDGHDVEKNSQT